MHTRPMSDLPTTFDDMGDAQLPRRLRVTAIAAGLSMLAFALIDAFVLPRDAAIERLVYRLAFSPVYALIAVGATSALARRNARLLAFSLAAVNATELSLITAAFPLKENAGYFPAMLFIAAVLPMPRRWLWAAQATYPLSFFAVQGASGWLGDPAVLRYGANVGLGFFLAAGAVFVTEGLRQSLFSATLRLGEANRRLLELDRLRTQFIAEVSHELRTPLAAALLSLDSDDSPKAQAALRPLRRLRGFIEDLLELSRIDARVVRPDGVATDLSQAVRTLSVDFRGAFEARDVTLSALAQPDARTLVPVGAPALDRILVILLGHALRRAPEGTDVVIESACERGAVTLVVSDKGPVIPPERLPHVFERFGAGDGSLADGVGLALARELVELHAGTISCTSTAERTTFEVRWREATGPIDLPSFRSERAGRIADAVAFALDGRPEPARPRLATTERTPQAGPEPLVLIVESHAELALRIAATLRPEYRTLVVPDAEQALSQLAETPPDLIVTDLRLGRMDGLSFLRTLRQNERTRLVPVLVLTAVADREHLLAAMRAGADDIMAKPFERELIRVRVDTLLRLKKRRDERVETRAVWMAAGDAMGHLLNARVFILRRRSNDDLAPVGEDDAPGAWGHVRDAWVEALVADGARAFRPEEINVEPLRGNHHLIAAPMMRREWLVGLVVASRDSKPFTEAETNALAASARYALLRIERDERFGHLSKSAEERRRLLAAVLQGQDSERNRLARDLHDGTGQVLIAAALRLDLALQAKDDETLRKQLTAGRELVDLAVEELRALSRDLHPPTLAQLGLTETLEVLAQGLSSDRLTITSSWDPGLETDLPANVAIGVYRIVQAALANVVRHARAERARIDVTREAESLVLSVTDNGIGFVVTGTEGGVGLLSIRERAEALGGSVDIDSVFGQGTRVRVRIPLPTRLAA